MLWLRILKIIISPGIKSFIWNVEKASKINLHIWFKIAVDLYFEDNLYDYDFGIKKKNMPRKLAKVYIKQLGKKRNVCAISIYPLNKRIQYSKIGCYENKVSLNWEVTLLYLEFFPSCSIIDLSKFVLIVIA